MVKWVSQRWRRAWILVGDGGYACVRLALSGRGSRIPVTLISRLRMDAQLYAFPRTPPPGRRGKKPSKGRRLCPLSQCLGELRAYGEDLSVTWYGGQRKQLRTLSGTCLWYPSGFAPVAIRWVLAMDLAKPDQAEAFFSTDLTLAPNG